MFMYGYWYLSAELKHIVQSIVNNKISFLTGACQKVYCKRGTGENQEEKGEEIASK